MKHLGLQAAFVIVVWLGLSEPSSAAGDEFEEGVAALKAGRTAEGIALLKHASDSGNVDATLVLGELTAGGIYVQQDATLACDYFERATSFGSAEGAHNLATCFFSGSGRRQDYARSKQLYEEAVSGGLLKSLCALGNQYRDGLGVAKDPQQADRLCRQAAEAGDADAQTDLGMNYLSGNTGERDFNKAAYWLELGARQGQVNALFNLGLMYANGDGVARDPVRARDLVVEAARRGRNDAFLVAGKLYFPATIDADTRTVFPEEASRCLVLLGLAAERDPVESNRTTARELYAVLWEVSPQAVRDQAIAMLQQWGASPP